MNRPAFIALAIVFACAVGAGGVLYAFGTPDAPALATAPTPQPVAAPPAKAVSQPGAEVPVRPDSAGQVPKPDPSVPLAIEIPGCVCHSDDPAIVEEHAQYRMNQCAGCHMGEVPTGQ